MNAARQAQVSRLASDVEAVLDELIRAHAIIAAMLNAMTTAQKIKVHKVLESAGVSDEGMVRANERMAVIKKAIGS